VWPYIRKFLADHLERGLVLNEAEETRMIFYEMAIGIRTLKEEEKKTYQVAETAEV